MAAPCPLCPPIAAACDGPQGAQGVPRSSSPAEPPKLGSCSPRLAPFLLLSLSPGTFSLQRWWHCPCPLRDRPEPIWGRWPSRWHRSHAVLKAHNAAMSLIPHDGEDMGLAAPNYRHGGGMGSWLLPRLHCPLGLCCPGSQLPPSGWAVSLCLGVSSTGARWGFSQCGGPKDGWKGEGRPGGKGAACRVSLGSATPFQKPLSPELSPGQPTRGAAGRVEGWWSSPGTGRTSPQRDGGDRGGC